MIQETLSLSTLIVCFIAIIIALKFFGRNGLYVYSTVAIVASNIQVLKLTNYYFIDHPVALGTVVFSTVFAVDNILNEYFGKHAAKECVWIGFFGYLFFVILMKISILHPVVNYTECTNMHYELQELFSPTLVLFISSLIAYLVSQFTDIFIFSALKNAFRGKYFASRSLVSMMISTFVDNCVFSVLAWVIFSQNPISLATLWKTYIFITYIIRLIIAVLCVPLVKLSGLFIEKTESIGDVRKI